MKHHYRDLIPVPFESRISRREKRHGIHSVLAAFGLLLALISASCSNACEILQDDRNQFTENTIEGDYAVELQFMNVDSVRKWYSRGDGTISEDREVALWINDTLMVNDSLVLRTITGWVSSNGDFIGSIGDSTTKVTLMGSNFVIDNPFQQIRSYFDLESIQGSDSLSIIKFEMNKL